MSEMTWKVEAWSIADVRRREVTFRDVTGDMSPLPTKCNGNIDKWLFGNIQFKRELLWRKDRILDQK